MTERELREAMAQYYIAPAVTEGSHYYKIALTYNPTIQMANMHAYKTIYALKEIAEETMFFPHDILTNEKSAEEIIHNGFFIWLRMREQEERIRQIVKPGYDLDRVDVEEVDEETFQRESLGSYPEKRVQQILDAINEQNTSYTPGDFVISEKKPGKAVMLAKDRLQVPEDAEYIRVEAAKLEQLTDLLRKLVRSQAAVLRCPELAVPGLVLDNFHEAAGQMRRITAEMQIVVNSMHES
jgi:two-component system chemotaxis sensor kinase CheA